MRYQTILKRESVLRNCWGVDFIGEKAQVLIGACWEWDKYKVIRKWTGLHDINNNLIYEGDKIKFGYENKNGSFYKTGNVIWVDKQACFAIDVPQGSINPIKRITETTIKKDSMEVVGNIYDAKIAH